MALLSLGVALYALVVYGLFPPGQFVHPEMRAVYAALPLAIYLHAFGAAVALALGPWQFLPRLRRDRPALHRWMGRVYLGVGVLVGGLAGLVLSFHAYGGWVSHSGFAILSLLWLYTGARAYAAIRRRDVAAHRRWMIRNFALTFAAVTLRLWMPLFAGLGVPFEVFYPLVAWISWVFNALAVEWWLRRRAP
jgi:uncharacterized membrane protein